MQYAHYLYSNGVKAYSIQAVTQERTSLIVQPEGVEQGHVGHIIERFEKHGLRVVALKLAQLSKELAKKQYTEHRKKAFFDE